MYTLLRKLHLYAGLVILVFLLMYFVSGWVMIHRPWFTAPGTKFDPEVRTEKLDGYNGMIAPESLAEYVPQRFGLAGRVNIPPPDQQPKGMVRFNVSRPGTNYLVEVPAKGQAVTIKTTRVDFAGTLVQLHRVHAYGGGWLFDMFVFFNDLASFACIVFALTGVYLWWKTATRKVWGFVCLGLSCAYGVGTILYLLYSR